MAKVLEELARSSDPIDRELSRTLQIFQNIRASRNLARSVGYEPRDIRSFGAVEVIERRIRNLSSGFDEDQVMAGDHAERPNAFIGSNYSALVIKLGHLPSNSRRNASDAATPRFRHVDK